MLNRPIVPVDAADVGVIAGILAMVVVGQKVEQEFLKKLLETIERLAVQIIEAEVSV